MSFTLVIKASAEKDIADIYTWYNEQKEGLGDVFIDQLELSLQFIENKPEQYQVRYKEVRMVKIDRFPICLHFTIERDRIFIHAVLNTYRDPKIWTNSPNETI